MLNVPEVGIDALGGTQPNSRKNTSGRYWVPGECRLHTRVVSGKSIVSVEISVITVRGGNKGSQKDSWK